MALINCPECKAEISDKAASCPKCAYPIAKQNAQNSTDKNVRQKKLLCPKCGSDKFSSNKKGYSAKKGAAGLLIPGGLLWGFHGSKKTQITCLSCSHIFKPGEGATSEKDFQKKKAKNNASTIGCLLIIAILLIIGYFSR